MNDPYSNDPVRLQGLLSEAKQRAGLLRSRRRKIVAGGAALLAVVAISAVYFLTPRAAHVYVGANPGATGTVQGDLRVVGGPSPGLNDPVTGTVVTARQYSGNESVASVMREPAVATSPTDSNGNFTLVLPAGQYMLTTPLSQLGQPCTLTVTVTAGQTTNADIACGGP
jgi:hypothetical protein